MRWRPGAAWATPVRALAALLAIEAGSGRRRRERWGPRTLDLDLLDGSGWAPAARGGFGARPTLPHPRAADRAFVLAPWAEVAPGWPAPRSASASAGEGAAGERSVAEARRAPTVADRAQAIGRSGVRPAGDAVAASWRAALAAVQSAPSADGTAAGRG